MNHGLPARDVASLRGPEQLRNEDGWAADVGLGVFAVADGLLSFADSAPRSHGDIAIEAFFHWLRSVRAGPLHPRLQGGFRTASGSLGDNGASLAVVVRGSKRFHVAWIGACRVYRLRGGVLERLTRDHTLLERLRERGQDTPKARSELGGILVRSLGQGQDPEPEIAVHPREPWDALLLCTQGVHGSLDDEEIRAGFYGSAAELVAKARERGTTDDATALFVRG